MICGWDHRADSSWLDVPYLIIFGLTGLLVVVFVRQWMSKATHTANRLNNMIFRDLVSGYFRNGIREQDIFKRYKHNIDYYQGPFEEEVLPTVVQALDDNKHIVRAKSRAGHMVWKLRSDS